MFVIWKWQFRNMSMLMLVYSTFQMQRPMVFYANVDVILKGMSSTKSSLIMHLMVCYANVWIGVAFFFFLLTFVS